jgi:hypothetical protein
MTLNQRILAGFLTRNEALIHANNLAYMPSPERRKSFWTAFKDAHVYREQLQFSQPTALILKKLNKATQPQLDAIEASNAFQENFGGLSYEFQEVNLDALLPIQLFANLEPKLTPPLPNEKKALLNFCLPIDTEIPSEIHITPTGVQFRSTRCGHGPTNIRWRIVNGQVYASFEHTNLITVIHFDGLVNGIAIDRAILINGTHRTLEMLKAGHKTVFAIVINVKTQEELATLCPQGFGMWNLDVVLFAGTGLVNFPLLPRPAILSDFLTPLGIEVPMDLLPSVVNITTSIDPNANRFP